MTIQLALVLLVVSTAIAYLLWQTVRAWSGGKTSCGGGCSCPTKAQEPGKPTLISADELMQRFRKE